MGWGQDSYLTGWGWWVSTYLAGVGGMGTGHGGGGSPTYLGGEVGGGGDIARPLPTWLGVGEGVGCPPSLVTESQTPLKTLPHYLAQ